jgi:hypothetical protein
MEKQETKKGRPRKETKETTSTIDQEMLLKLIQEQKEAIDQLKNELSDKSKPQSVTIAAPEPAVTVEDIKNISGYDLSAIKDLNLPKRVFIKRYINQRDENLGLTAQGIAMVDGQGGQAGFKESMGYLTIAGKNYYLNGFEDHCFNIKSIKNPEQREAAKKEAQKIKKILENILGVDLSSTNSDFWRNINLIVRKPIYTLNLQEPYDLLIYYAILGGGFTAVAPSKEIADDSNIRYKHYLHIDSEVQKQSIGIKRLRNKAIAKLEEMYDNSEADKMFMVAKNVLPASKGFTKKDSIDRLYNDLHDYIHGVNISSNIKNTPKKFFASASRTLEDLTVNAVINDGVYYRFLKPNEDKFYYNTDTFTVVGKNPAEIIEFYKNPINSNEFEDLYLRVKEVWTNS